jgi:hypothetical protein
LLCRRAGQTNADPRIGKIRRLFSALRQPAHRSHKCERGMLPLIRLAEFLLQSSSRHHLDQVSQLDSTRRHTRKPPPKPVLQQPIQPVFIDRKALDRFGNRRRRRVA